MACFYKINLRLSYRRNAFQGWFKLERERIMTNQNAMVTDSRSTINLSITVKVSESSLFAAATPAGYISISRKALVKNLEINGGVVNAWVESMRASSPSRSCSSLIDEHKLWMRRHPSALDMFGEVIEASKGKQVVMFLDYDGTLSPIVDDPDRAFMSAKMRKTVRRVAKFFPTAIVSGRCRDKVYKFVRLAELYYAGSHGMDIKGPAKGAKYKKGSHDLICQPASEFLPMIDEVYKELLDKTRSTPGSKVENNKFCVSVHFRRVEEKEWSNLIAQVRSVLKAYPKLRLSQGRKVLEIRPSIKWDKGKALEFLLESLGYANCADVYPVYIGDDKTDEDAFKVLRDRGQGCGILVSKFPRETSASYSLQEPTEVMDFLQRLVEWKRGALQVATNIFKPPCTLL